MSKDQDKDKDKDKDPAFLFYPADFIVGTRLFSFEQKGKYIELLCLQHQHGHLSQEDIDNICGGHDPKVFAKFVQDEQGLYYNVRLEKEMEKRAKFVGSRQSNGALGGRPKKPTQNLSVSSRLTYEEPTQNLVENINVNINVIKDIIEYLNGVLGAKYKFSSDYIQRTIGDRLKEGYTFPDFKAVIDKKYAEWNGTEMARFLRPETLFGPKFDSYLNAPTVPRQNGKTGQIIPSGSSFTTEDAMARALARSYGEEGGNVG